nr:ATP-dependent helicase [Streptomyces sp. MOE7]
MHVSSSFSAAPATQPHQAARRAAPGAYRLVRTPPEQVDPPALDAAQQAVVDHRHGPLLVLAGPGTGKTTTLVESVARRIRAGADPDRILVLTFSRKAAVALRDRLAARLGTGFVPQATTFHSYCYALVRAHQDADLFADPMRLLSGPEQDLVVRELLEGQAELAGAGRATISWPDELRACLTTRGFADEVRAVLARSRELGLGPDALGDFARRTGRPDWTAAAGFLAEYLDVLDAQGVLDYAELVHRAVLLAGHTDVAAELAARYDAVYVDEYQDTDVAQVRLLRALAGNHSTAGAPGSPGRTLIAFGDPDQSIYAFRGADVNGILDFPETFRRGDGAPAPVAVLGTSRRSGATLLAATRLLTRRMPLTRLPADKVRAHREPSPVRDGGRVEVYTYPTPGTELDNVADILRRAHLEDGVPWREMAVLVRAGGRSIPAVRRALTSAGVPLDIDGDDLPLRHEPAVAPLLTALRAAARAALTTPPEPTAPDDGAAAATPDDGAAAAAPRTSGTRPTRAPLPSAQPTGAPPKAAGIPPPGPPPPPGSTPKPPSTCSPPPWAAWTPPTCAAWAAPCARRNAPPDSRCRPPPTSSSPAPSPNPSAWSPTTPATPAAPSGSDCCCARPANCSPAAAPPSRPSGSYGTAPPGRSAWSGPPGAAAPPAATPTATWTRWSPSSRPPPAPRSAPAAAAPSTSWRNSTPRTSPPTPSPAAPSAPTPSA